MPTEAPCTLAERRILRFAIGTAIALAFSQALNWDHAFLAVVFATMFLGLPIPAPGLRGGLLIMLALLAGTGLGMLIIWPLDVYPVAGIGALSLLFFGVFYYGLRGGNPLVGAMLTMGISVVPVVGVFDIQAAIDLTVNLLKGVVVGVSVMWLGHAVFPDPAVSAGRTAKRPPPPDAGTSGRLAVRSTLVVMPAILWLLATGALDALIVAIKVASLGQQASADSTREAGASLLASTVIGGAAASTVWLLLKIWPSLVIYVLLVLLAALVLGRRVFAGPAFAPKGPVFSYAMVTAVVILGPVVLDSGDSAGARFVERILRFVVATLYAVFAVSLFDALFGSRLRLSREPAAGSSE